MTRKTRGAGTKLDRFRMSIRDSRVKLTHASAREIITQARTEFSPATWQTVVPWLYAVLTPQLRRLLPRKLEVWGHVQIPMAPITQTLEKELWWCAACVEQSIQPLVTFLVLSEKYEQAYAQGDRTRCEQILIEIQATTGYSLWLLRASIHNAATFEGLEAQKERAHSIIRSSPRSLASFLSWYISERNEEKVLISVEN